MREFNGRVAYVTGGSSGLGLAVASELLRLGAHVALIARDPLRLEAAAARLAPLRASADRRIVTRVCDVADADQVARTVDGLVGELGAPDLLVNNAGYAYINYFELVTPEQMRQMAATNLFGVYNVVHAALPHMKSRGGTIVNVASIGGLVGYFGAAAYCATKFGVVGFSEALRSELAPSKIRVAVLCPPNTATPGLDRENLTKPAETHAVEGTAGTYSPERVAQALIRGLRGRRFIILCGFMSRLTDAARRLVPALVHGMMDGDVARARSKTTKETLR